MGNSNNTGTHATTNKMLEQDLHNVEAGYQKKESCSWNTPLWSQAQTRSWGNRHLNEDGTKPQNVIQIATEGNMAVFSGDAFDEPLEPALRDLGVTEANWVMCQDKLKATWGRLFKSDFKQAIDDLNSLLFTKVGCHAVYGGEFPVCA